MTTSDSGQAGYSSDPVTLRETVNSIEAVTSRIDELKSEGTAGDAERISWLRMIGRLAEAEELGWRMLEDRGGADQHRSVTEPLPYGAVTVALRLAHVLHWQEDHSRAEDLFQAGLNAAISRAGQEDDSAETAQILTAFAWQHLGKLRYDQGR